MQQGTVSITDMLVLVRFCAPSTDSLRQGGAGAGWLGSSAGGLRPGHLVLLKLLQEMPMTMRALSSRQTVGRPQSRKWGEVSSAQWQRWPGGPSRGRGAPVAQARRDMSGDRGARTRCATSSHLAANYDRTGLKT